MAVEAAIQPSKLRWGELEEDDGEDLDFLLPPKQVIGPDENGIKKVVEYKFNEEGNKVKITTTTRIRKLANARLSKRAVERRSWSKFGDAVHEDVGSRLTMVSTEEILLERPRAPGRFYICSYVFLYASHVLFRIRCKLWCLYVLMEKGFEFRALYILGVIESVWFAFWLWNKIWEF